MTSLPTNLATNLATTAPARTVHHGDALPWLRAAGTLAGASVVTSLPDVSELPALGFDGWRRWFDEAAALTMQSVPDEGVAIFFQSDVKRAGLWVDKGAMVSRAAERAGMAPALPQDRLPQAARDAHLRPRQLLAPARLRARAPAAAPARHARRAARRRLSAGREVDGRARLRRRLPVRARRDHHAHDRRSVLRLGHRARGRQRPRARRDGRRSVRAHVQARAAPLGHAWPVAPPTMKLFHVETEP